MSQLLEGHTDGIAGLSHDGQYVYSGSKDRTLRIWDKQRRECVHVIDGFPCSCRGVSDGGDLLTITWHGLKHRYVAIWERETWRKLHELELPASPNADLEGIVLDKHYAFVPARDGKVFVIDRNTCGLVRTLQQSQGGIWDIAVDASFVYTTSVDQTITMWGKAVWQPARELIGHKGNIQGLAQDEHYLYSIATDKTMIAWDKQTGEAVATLKQVHKKGLLGIVCTDNHVLAMSKSQGVKVWRKGAWAGNPLVHPNIHTNRAIVNKDHIWFAENDGSLAVYSLQELGIGN